MIILLYKQQSSQEDFPKTIKQLLLTANINTSAWTYLFIPLTNSGSVTGALVDMFDLLVPSEGDSTVRAGGLSQAIVHLPDVSPEIGQPVLSKLLATYCTGKPPTGCLQYTFTNSWIKEKTHGILQGLKSHKSQTLDYIFTESALWADSIFKL